MTSFPENRRQVNVQEARTHLSALLVRVEVGEEIVLARERSPLRPAGAAGAPGP